MEDSRAADIAIQLHGNQIILLRKSLGFGQQGLSSGNQFETHATLIAGLPLVLRHPIREGTGQKRHQRIRIRGLQRAACPRRPLACRPFPAFVRHCPVATAQRAEDHGQIQLGRSDVLFQPGDQPAGQSFGMQRPR